MISVYNFFFTLLYLEPLKQPVIWLMTTKIWSKFYDLYTMYNIEPEIFGKGGGLQLVPTTMTHTDHALYNCTYFTGLIFMVS